jgi:hypothetical protein
VTGRTAIRFVKPSAAQWLKAFGITLACTYVLMIPVTWFWIQQAGMGTNASVHLTVGKVLAGFAMLCLMWTPFMCLWCSPVLLPLGTLIAFVGAGLRRVPAAD